MQINKIEVLTYFSGLSVKFDFSRYDNCFLASKCLALGRHRVIFPLFNGGGSEYDRTFIVYVLDSPAAFMNRVR